ncbi:class I adenylate-forming enzyme family protein [Luteithermobacter gelatinilyticus]|uniref:class I adenylate-forming enzyme family protein n=1 Tax=Luteithermobacter gelatinilyticus TaxID=2582913 RepID=UPI001105EA76|nr:class I adenylate-forming enzyme family protein [Luteithermobacter gelatinilyticus]
MIVCDEQQIREYTDRGWWGQECLHDLFERNVAAVPNRVAAIDPLNRTDFTDGAPKRHTYRELKERVDQFARLMVHLGLKKDDILLIQMPNVMEYFYIYLAASRLGIIVSPVPMQYRDRELAQIARILEPAAIVTTNNFKGGNHAEGALLGAAYMEEHGLARPMVLSWGDKTPDGAISLDELMEQELPEGTLRSYLETITVTANDVFTICWTSGTEGKPKGIPRTHNHWIAISYGTFDGSHIQEGDILLNPFPMINMASIGGLFMSWLHSKGTLVLHHPLDLPTFLRQIATEKVTFTLVPPALLNMLLKDEALMSRVDIGSIRAIGSGSAPLDEWMVKGYLEKYGIQIINHFGSNEGVSLISGAEDVPDPERRARYFPRFGVKGYAWANRVAERLVTRIVDPETGEEITTPRRPGELQIKGAGVFAGYFKAPEQTRQAFTDDGYFKTGDMFQIAGDGEEEAFYQFVGRCKDIIIRGGMNIAPAELDDLLNSHADIEEAAVAGYPDDVLGERIAAFVVPRAGVELSLEDIVEFLKGKHIASFKLPEKLVFVKELPRNPLGKVIRRDLLQYLEGSKHV